ncbi:MAG: hypothetical protein QOK43_531 [Acidimicrobiaceae bacterium]|nr:hypothetical protein [Acidimicrobiaceae bacterium]
MATTATPSVVVLKPGRAIRPWHGALAAVLTAALVGSGTFVVVHSRESGAAAGAPAVASAPAPPAASAQASGITAQWVKDENAKRGTSAWRLDDKDDKKASGIEGFADAASAVQGDAVGLYVSTKADQFHVEAYRMGYYGGDGGRLVWRSAQTQGRRQAVPVIEPKTRMVEAEWEPSLSVRIGPEFVPGVYLFKLVGDGGQQQYIPLTVRDDQSTSAYVVQNAVTTWQAYNLWGGADLYEGRMGKVSGFDQRSRVVSFDRPYMLGEGSGDFLGNELPLVSLVESLGLDVTYWTDVDLHRRPALLARHRALVTLGHDEYWSASMRDGAEAARDHGVNLAFLGANAAFRQIRLEDSPLGVDRRVVNYKRAHEDPMRLDDPSLVTVDWRQAPVSRPENALVGPLYECNPVKADMVVYDAGGWVFQGTGLKKGDTLADVVGSEYDRAVRTPTTPASLQVLAHSPVTCRGRKSYADMTYYTAPSGAGVFATGTNLWVPRTGTVAEVARITVNVLRAFGAGPAGLQHPAVPNLPRAAR